MTLSLWIWHSENVSVEIANLSRQNKAQIVNNVGPWANEGDAGPAYGNGSKRSVQTMFFIAITCSILIEACIKEVKC